MAGLEQLSGHPVEPVDSSMNSTRWGLQVDQQADDVAVGAPGPDALVMRSAPPGSSGDHQGPWWVLPRQWGPLEQHVVEGLARCGWLPGICRALFLSSAGRL